MNLEDYDDEYSPTAAAASRAPGGGKEHTMIRDLLRILHCHFTRGHQYGAWEFHDLSRGRRMYTRACKRCGWITTHRDYTPGADRR